MTLADRLRIAWACEACRFYRRIALALGVLAIAVWLLRQVGS
jgi:hypothetical protein